jgi:hypothetical protein
MLFLQNITFLPSRITIPLFHLSCLIICIWMAPMLFHALLPSNEFDGAPCRIIHAFSYAPQNPSCLSSKFPKSRPICFVWQPLYLENFGDLENLCKIWRSHTQYFIWPIHPSLHAHVWNKSNPPSYIPIWSMHASNSISISNYQNSFETPPNPSTNYSSTLTSLWSKLHCSRPSPSCPLVVGSKENRIHANTLSITKK